MHEVCWKNTTRCWKLCFTSFSVKNSLLPNYKAILLNGAFCLKSTQRIQLAVENAISLQFVSKTLLFQIIRISLLKVRFAWNLLKEYNSLLKTVFHFILCSKLLFPKLKGYLAKKYVLHEICSKNTTRCWKLCYSSL